MSEWLGVGIIKGENLKAQSRSIGCYVQIDGRLHDVITPLNEENTENEVIVPLIGLIRFIVKDMSCTSEVIGSVSFDLRLLKTGGFQWLPLYTNMAKDQIFYLPLEVKASRILVHINNNQKIARDPAKTHVYKNTEVVDSFQNENLQKFKEVNEIEKKYQENLAVLSIENENIKKTNEKYSLLLEDVSKELKASKALLAEERKVRNEAEMKVGMLTTEYEGNLKRANHREIVLLQKLEEKDKEIVELNSLISQLKVIIRNLKHEKQQIVDVVDEYQAELALNNITRLNQEVILVKSLLEESEIQRHRLQDYIQKPQESSKNTSFLTSKEISTELDEISESTSLNSMCSVKLLERDKRTEFKENLNVSYAQSMESAMKNGVLMLKDDNSFIPIPRILGTEGKDQRKVVTPINITNSEEIQDFPLKANQTLDGSYKCTSKSYKHTPVIDMTSSLKDRISLKRLSKRLPFK